jgi:hypothetical protein
MSLAQGMAVKKKGILGASASAVTRKKPGLSSRARYYRVIFYLNATQK